MQITNIRLGLATNSSSSHSIIFLPEGAEDAYKPWEFGWDFFTLASPYAKLQYLTVTVYQALRRVLPARMARFIAWEWLGIEIPTDEIYDCYVDHQSLLALPNDFHFDVPDEQFVRELAELMAADSVVVLGGNDNDEAEHVLANKGRKLLANMPRNDVSRWTCRKDVEQGFWTLFNRTNGAKIRLWLDTDEHDGPRWAYAPEMVDVKITDFCPFECEYCYQGSGKSGEHATVQSVNHLAWILKQLKVFEVAIGGGEPTFHPDFEEVLYAFRRNNIVPNFTTRSLAWLHDPKLVRTVLEPPSAFAYSVQNAAQVDELAALLQHNGISPRRAGVHVVLGTVLPTEFKMIMEACAYHGLPATLLGFKAVGRGDSYEAMDYDWWLESLMSLPRRPRLSIDTALAAEFERELKEAGVPSVLYHTDEGTFSCYVDLVRGKMAPSSFCSERQYVDLPSDAYQFVEAFYRFRPTEQGT